MAASSTKAWTETGSIVQTVATGVHATAPPPDEPDPAETPRVAHEQRVAPLPVAAAPAAPPAAEPGIVTLEMALAMAHGGDAPAAASAPDASAARLKDASGDAAVAAVAAVAARAFARALGWWWCRDCYAPRG